jgi:2-C-methyl-D-erythritol 4-phosphate cytidylyltransferase
MAITETSVWCVVPAAGRSARVGGEIPKQYMPIGGKPMLMHTLTRLAMHPRVAGLMVVLAARDVYWAGMGSLRGKPVRTAIGGDERADSVLAGLRALREQVEDSHFVLVHDAARPCVRNEDISRLLEMGIPAGGGLLAAPMHDTLKRAGTDNRVVVTEPRDTRWRALTPQLFRYGELAAALQAAIAAGVTITDESMAMERTGQRPLLVEGSADNIKVTTAPDFALAEFMIQRTAMREA